MKVFNFKIKKRNNYNLKRNTIIISIFILIGTIIFFSFARFESKETFSLINGNVKKTMLINGENFNVELKRLAGNENAGFWSDNTTIKTIERSMTEPTSDKNYVNVADNTSSYPIYAWFENETIYIYSKSDQIYLNGDISYMFSGLKNIESVDLTMFNTSNVTNMYAMFSGCSNLTNLDFSHFRTSNVTNMNSMFSGCSKLTSLDLSTFDTSNVVSMNYMFGNMTNLTYLKINTFDTSKVTDMYGMFTNLEKITELDISNFNTASVENMSYMFYGMNNITSLDLESLNTSNVVGMVGMFSKLGKIETLDLSNFDTGSLETMYYMFKDSPNLKTIYVSDKWTTSAVDPAAGANVFTNSTKIIGGAGTSYDSNQVSYDYARVDDPQNGKPGYFTLKTN